jgi:hypothetical protein
MALCCRAERGSVTAALASSVRPARQDGSGSDTGHRNEGAVLASMPFLDRASAAGTLRVRPSCQSTTVAAKAGSPQSTNDVPTKTARNAGTGCVSLERAGACAATLEAAQPHQGHPGRGALTPLYPGPGSSVCFRASPPEGALSARQGRTGRAPRRPKAPASRCRRRWPTRCRSPGSGTAQRRPRSPWHSCSRSSCLRAAGAA